MSGNETILEVRNLKKYFFSGKKRRGREPRAVKALDGVSFSMEYGETLGVVGESGCGKSTLGRTILRLHEPTEGQVVYRGKNLAEYGREEMRQMRRELQIIFQDPYSSLNPRMTVKELICAPLDVFAMGSKEEKEARVIEIMDKVGLPLEFMNRYPHEFSGGQRQRIVIARALVLNPRFVVCDEPVSALDVSVRAQVLNLLSELQKIYVYAAHSSAAVIDLNLVRRSVKEFSGAGGIPHCKSSSGKHIRSNHKQAFNNVTLVTFPYCISRIIPLGLALASPLLFPGIPGMGNKRLPQGESGDMDILCLNSLRKGRFNQGSLNRQIVVLFFF